MNKKWSIIIILWFLTGCVSYPAKGTDMAALMGKERPSFESTYHYSLGVLHILDDNLDEAIIEYEKALSFDPQSLYLITELISLYIEKGEIQKAIKLCRKTLYDNPADLNIHLLLGGLYLNIKDYNNAISEYTKVIK
ncbi:MAG TPA: tetratricopeptide repeat protein, partial [Syntrophales bacterium]|nr:tetratricopeptide repeat protein [Syntrophales bacterium]